MSEQQAESFAIAAMTASLQPFVAHDAVRNWRILRIGSNHVLCLVFSRLYLHQMSLYRRIWNHVFQPSPHTQASVMLSREYFALLTEERMVELISWGHFESVLLHLTVFEWTDWHTRCTHVNIRYASSTAEVARRWSKSQTSWAQGWMARDYLLARPLGTHNVASRPQIKTLGRSMAKNFIHEIFFLRRYLSNARLADL